MKVKERGAVLRKIVQWAAGLHIRRVLVHVELESNLELDMSSKVSLWVNVNEEDSPESPSNRRLWGKMASGGGGI